MQEQVILVDENDNQIGTMEKIAAHENSGKLHRAFSIFIFNSEGKMLLQLRAKSKYHFGGLWTNTCCSHPRPGENTEDAAHRKLKQEMGFDCELREILTSSYRVTDKNSGLTEYEFGHVFIGKFNGKVKPNPEEADDYKWIDINKLKEDIKNNPDKYTPWFKIVFEKGFETFKSIK